MMWIAFQCRNNKIEKWHMSDNKNEVTFDDLAQKFNK